MHHGRAAVQVHEVDPYCQAVIGCESARRRDPFDLNEICSLWRRSALKPCADLHLGLLDGIEALEATGSIASEINLIGGGSRSAYWAQMLVDVSGRTLTKRAGGDVGPALGAARLAHLAVAPGANVQEVCRAPAVELTFAPDEKRHAFFRDVRRPRFKKLCRSVAPLFENRPQAICAQTGSTRFRFSGMTGLSRRSLRGGRGSLQGRRAQLQSPRRNLTRQINSLVEAVLGACQCQVRSVHRLDADQAKSPLQQTN